MVISHLNTSRILELLRFVESCVQELQPYSALSRDDFLSDKKNPPFVESYLRRALEAVFDIGRHILAKTYGSKEIEYKRIAKELHEKGVISKELSDVLFTMAGYRNRMVHFYREITPEELHDIIVKNLRDFDVFTKEIVQFLKAYESAQRHS